MNKRSKYIHIEDVSHKTPSKKTKNFIVSNTQTRQLLGWINWYPPFRKYAFTSNINIIYDPNCLEDIADFLKDLMVKHND